MALHLAAQSSHEAALRVLIEDGANIHVKDGQGRTALHLAAEKGHEGVLQLLIKNGTSAHEKDNRGRMALHLAAKNGHEAVLRLLIKNRAVKAINDFTGLDRLIFILLVFNTYP